MTQDEIRKLLGGYAANTLTEDERKVLFEAALEDQDLFNALQNEDALRELIEDPAARAAMRRGLEKRRAGFWSRRWIFGVLVPAAAAVVAIAVMYQPEGRVVPTGDSEPRLPAPAPQTETQPATPPVAAVAPPVAKQQQVSRARPNALPAPAPAPIPVPPSTAEEAVRARPAFAPALASARDVAPIPETIRAQFSSSAVVNAPLYQGPLVKYSLIRSGPEGQDIRVEVTPQVGGYLALFQVDESGNSTRVYPASEPAEVVFPNRTIQVPRSPIKVAEAGERLRLVVVPSPAPPLNGVVGGVVGSLANKAIAPAPLAPKQAAPAPLVIDIPLAPH